MPRPTLAQCAALLRRIIGAPDYDEYLAFMARRHPDRLPLTKAEFDQQRLDARYNSPGATRCC